MTFTLKLHFTLKLMDAAFKNENNRQSLFLVIIICHDFLPPPWMGSHVKSDYASMQNHLNIHRLAHVINPRAGARHLQPSMVTCQKCVTVCRDKLRGAGVLSFIKLMIIYHDFLPTPRRGSHVKSDKTHTQSSRYTP